MKSFFHKNLIALMLAALGIALYFVLAIFIYDNSLYYESSLRNLRETARSLIAVLPEGFLEDFFKGQGDPAWLERLEQKPRETHGVQNPLRITLIRPDGRVLADSRLDPEGAVNHADRNEFRAALAGETGTARRHSASLGTEYLYAALPVHDRSGRIIGVFRASLMVESFHRRLSLIILPFLGCGLLVIGGVFAGLYLFSRSLTRPLGDLAAAARSVYEESGAPADPSAGKYFEIREFAILDSAFRSMAAGLKARLEKAQAEGRRLEAILNGMDEAVLALDENLVLRLINPRARSLFAITQTAPLSLQEAGCPGELEEAAKTALAEKKALERELRLHIGGKARYLRLFAAPLSGSNGDRVVMVLGDLTRLHKLERVRQDFAANVSHELRTPIQLIKGFAETLQETGAGGDQLHRGLEIIRKNALTMENLTNDLLSLVSLEDEAQPRPELVMTRVKGLIDEAVSSVGNAAEKKHISIKTECDPALEVPLHGTFMVQALVNLLDNGVKYSPAGSKVWVEASITEKEGPELSITVRDQGIGIPAEHQSRIFERFYRVDKSRSREQGGTGLGLAIVRHIALIHRGEVEVESHAGEGSAFTLRIPVSNV